MRTPASKATAQRNCRNGVSPINLLRRIGGLSLGFTHTDLHQITWHELDAVYSTDKLVTWKSLVSNGRGYDMYKMYIQGCRKDSLSRPIVVSSLVVFKTTQKIRRNDCKQSFHCQTPALCLQNERKGIAVNGRARSTNEPAAACKARTGSGKGGHHRTAEATGMR